METKKEIGKHTTVNLKIGEVVRVEGWGFALDNKDLIIEDIKRGQGQSGFVVKLHGYPRYIDSDWITKK